MTESTSSPGGPATAETLQGAAIIAALKDAGVRTVVALPDIVTCETVLWPLSEDSSLRLVPVCKEDEGVSICAALSYCDHRPALLFQHTGFLDSINAIRVIAVEYALPVVMLVGLQGMEPDRSPNESESLSLRILIPMLEAMGLKHRVLASAADCADLAATIERCYRDSEPYVFLIARSPA